MKTKIILCGVMLLFGIIILAQKNQKYVPSEPPPIFFKNGKTYHFAGKGNGLIITLELKQKTAVSIMSNLKIIFPDKKVLVRKTELFLSEAYDFGGESREKPSTGEGFVCTPYFQQQQSETNYLEVCVGEQPENEKDFLLSLICYAPGYPRVDLDNVPDIVEVK